MFSSNITLARVNARWFYLNKKARIYLEAGRTKVHLAGYPGNPFHATVKPEGTIPNIAVHCPPLFDSETPPLPLRNGDTLIFEIRAGEVYILQIKRGRTEMLTSKPLGESTPCLGNEESEEGPDQPENRNPPPLPNQNLPEQPKAWDGNLPEGMTNDCLSLHRFPPLPYYLCSNRHRILALGGQALPPWSTGYDAFQEPAMQRLRYAFPTRCISRAELVALFHAWQDPVLCLVAAMVWGGIRLKHLNLLLLMGEPALRARMEALRPLVRSAAFEVAFKDCSTGGRLKFDGVGPAFFTKLFYFIGQVPPILNPAPLILDKWTANAFLVLGRQICQSNRWLEWFDTAPLCKGKPTMWHSPFPDAEVYRLYVAWFNHWAQLLGAPVSQLEQFVFGWDRRGGENQWWNPRNQLIKLGHSQFCPPPGT